ncbi:MAG TPA: HAMP domain-containing sensor histidine kinase, partial [Candidatus Dormibacteraeota bacterium]|nr:HAMP domain-containing sensor histidine kinase [Candidatus Dormibacteraeota bacterium]
MKRPRWRLARMAAIPTVVVLALYVIVMTAIDVGVFRSLVADADAQVTGRVLEFAHGNPEFIRNARPEASAVPIFAWLYGNDGNVVLAMPGAPTAPSGLHPVAPASATIDGQPYRVQSIPALDLSSGQSAGWLVVGRSVADVYASTLRLAIIEGSFGLPLLLLTFFGSLWFARRTIAPVEEARRRQLAFTADASHELRTPLTVIEAEASLALQKERDAESYRTTIERIASEGARLRRIVEDLLWLARFESEPDRPGLDTVDVGEIATGTVARFRHVAHQRGIKLEGRVTALAPPLVTAPADWIDRLAGVLVDNACRYTPGQGSVEVSVVTGEGRVRLAVDDSGPGIPAEERARIFDRFHRANDKPGGAGLGLAIGNAIVNATAGRWEVADSPAGGTRMAVSWPLVRPPRELEPSEDAVATPAPAQSPAVSAGDRAGVPAELPV